MGCKVQQCPLEDPNISVLGTIGIQQFVTLKVRIPVWNKAEILNEAGLPRSIAKALGNIRQNSARLNICSCE